MQLLKILKDNKSLGLQFFLLGRFLGTFLVSVLLAKSSRWLSSPLSTADIGDYELFLFIAGFIGFFWINAMIRGLLGFIDISNSEQINHRLAQVFYLFGLLSVAFGVIFFLAQFCFQIVEHRHTYIFTGAIIYSVFFTPSILLEYVFLIKQRSTPMILSAFITPFFLLLFSISGAIFTQSINGVIAGNVIFGALRFLTTAVIVFRKRFYKIDCNWIKRYIHFTLPLLLSLLIAESGVYVDGIIVNTLFDQQTFAIFRYGARELPLNSILTLGLSNAMIPMFAKLSDIQTQLDILKQKTNRLLYFLVPFSAIILISSDWLYANIFNETFRQSAPVFDIYLLLVLPRLLLPQTLIVGLKHNRLLVGVSIIEISTNIILSLWWGIAWGIYGIALATLASFIAEKTTMIYLVNTHLKISPAKYIPVKTYLLMAVMLITVYLLKYLIFK